MIIDEIKKANIEAMKSHDQNLRAIYSVLNSKYLSATIDARTSGKEVDDEAMIKIIQKTIKELDEEASNYLKVNNMEEVEKINKQKTALEKYLPVMMSKDELRAIYVTLEDKSVPAVMKYFKANYGSKCDLKVVQEIMKENA